jgi:hypothetical protein
MKAYVIMLGVAVGATLWAPLSAVACYTKVGSSCLNYNYTKGWNSICTAQCNVGIVHGKKVTMLYINGRWRVVKHP